MDTLNRSLTSGRWLVTLAGLACVLGTSSVFADMTTKNDGNTETRSIKVSFADLDLDKPADAAELYKRIQRAAQVVCGPRVSANELGRMYDARRCSQQAISDAVAQVNRPTLTAVHRNVTGPRHG
ncbi:MAG: UrcA family protein [Pseudomonadota bacterium]|jgi:hypothetical protein